MPWLKHPLILTSRMIELQRTPFDTLFDVARDRAIWRLTSVDYSDPAVFYPNFMAALHGRGLGKAYPFLVRLNGGGPVIGTARLLDIRREDRKVEIGVTWIASAYWGSGANTECKFLLLGHCFEALEANRVTFRARSDNSRSRRALEKIGAVFEGVMRKDRIEPGGHPRDTAFYSLLREEWPAVKAALAARLVVR